MKGCTLQMSNLGGAMKLWRRDSIRNHNHNTSSTHDTSTTTPLLTTGTHRAGSQPLNYS